MHDKHGIEIIPGTLLCSEQAGKKTPHIMCIGMDDNGAEFQWVWVQKRTFRKTQREMLQTFWIVTDLPPM